MNRQFVDQYMPELFSITANSPEQTQDFARLLGKIAEPDTIIALVGELGAGKTCFVQGLAAGLEVPEDCYITSPTFTLINEYPGRLTVYHADLYRLNSVEDLEDIGFFDMLNSGGITAIEWADKLLPSELNDYVLIRLKEPPDPNQGEIRQISVAAKGHNSTFLAEKIRKEMIFD